MAPTPWLSMSPDVKPGPKAPPRRARRTLAWGASLLVCSIAAGSVGFFGGRYSASDSLRTTPKPPTAAAPEPIREPTARAEPEPPKTPPKPELRVDYTHWTLERTFQWGSKELSCVAFSPDGRTIAVGGGAEWSVPSPRGGNEAKGTGLVRLWDAATGQAKGTFTDPDRMTGSIAFYPDGESLAVGDSDKLKVLDSRSGLLRFRVPVPAHSLTLNGPNGVIVTAYHGEFWDMLSGEARPYFARSTTPYPAFSPDGTLLCDGGALWSYPTGVRVGSIPSGPSVFSHDGRFVATLFGVWKVDGVIPVWARPKPYPEYQRDRCLCLAFTPDDKFLFVASFETSCLEILDSASGRVVSSLRPHDQYFASDLSPDGQFLVTGVIGPSDEETRIKVWKAASRP